MELKELARALDVLLQNAGRRLDAENAKQVAILRQFFAEHPTIPLEDFYKFVAKGLKPKKRPTERTTATAKNFNETAVRQYLDELASTQESSNEFEQVVARMKGDKRVKIAEARAIASGFLGGSQIFKTKADTFKAILHRQFTNVRAAHKIERIADIF